MHQHIDGFGINFSNPIALARRVEARAVAKAVAPLIARDTAGQTAARPSGQATESEHG